VSCGVVQPVELGGVHVPLFSNTKAPCRRVLPASKLRGSISPDSMDEERGIRDSCKRVPDEYGDNLQER